MTVKRYDGWLFLSVLGLLGFGVVMVYSTSSYYAQIRFEDGLHFLKRQGLFALLGIVVMSMFMMLDYRLLRRFVYVILPISFILLGLLWIPGLGRKAGGALRWIDMGLIWIQPSEPAKLGLLIYLAHIVVKKSDRMHTFGKGFMPPVIVSGLMILLVFLQPDFGTAATMGALVMAMLFVGGANPFHVVGSTVLAAPILYVGLMGAEYRRERILAFLDPWSSPRDAGFQIIQSYIALGNGGVTGVGLGMSSQKLFYLPMAHTDFVLSVIGEELGLVGICAVVAAFIVILVRGLKAAIGAPDSFGAKLAAGLTFMIAIESLVNMGVVMGLLPTKGLPLPLLSYGGTSLVVTMAAAGILLNVSAAPDESLRVYRMEGDQ